MIDLMTIRQRKGVLSVAPAVTAQKAARILLQVPKLKHRRNKVNLVFGNDAAGKALEQMAAHACQIEQVGDRGKQEKVDALLTHGLPCTGKAGFI